MSASLETQNGSALPVKLAASQQNVHSDPDDGSSSLSDIEDKEAEQEDLESLGSEDEDEVQHEGPVDNSVGVDEDANDSEAETERLEDSPHKLRTQKDVVVNSQTESRVYERSPSKLQHAFAAEGDDADVDDLSDAPSLPESAKSLADKKIENDQKTVATSLQGSVSDEQSADSVGDKNNKKRKRSQLVDHGSLDVDDTEEHARKRKGSVADHNDEHAIDDTASANGDPQTSNPISGDVSDAETEGNHSNQEQTDHNDVHDEEGTDDEAADSRATAELSQLEAGQATEYTDKSTDHTKQAPDTRDDRGRDEAAIDTHDRDSREGEDVDDMADAEADEAEAALKNEEEQERRRTALDQLNDIERHFASFRDRLHDERLAQLDREEAMLRAESPTHPIYLEMMQSIDARRDQKLTIEASLTKLRLESIQREAVGKRSQILAQFYQEVREIREKKLEALGRQWYDIQHDRRGYGSHVEDFAFKFPTKRARQITHHNAFTKEVSLLAGISKYVGFPAAPAMSAATPAEINQDLGRMGRQQQKSHAHKVQHGLPLQDFTALRAAASASSTKPAEDQFIEQTPWANPQHPSHAHIIQRQASAHQAARNSSPFPTPDINKARRHSQQHTTTVPLSGIFSGPNAGARTSKGNSIYMTGGRISPPHNASNIGIANKPAPALAEGGQNTRSPDQVRHPPSHDDSRRHEVLEAGSSRVVGIFPLNMDPNRAHDPQLQFPYDNTITVKREHALGTVGRF